MCALPPFLANNGHGSDTVLRRVCELAETCAARDTRIIACEVLHGLVLWLIGSRVSSLGSPSVRGFVLPPWCELAAPLIT